MSVAVMIIGVGLIGAGFLLVSLRRRVLAGIIVALVGFVIGSAGYWGTGEEGDSGDVGTGLMPTSTLSPPAEPTP